jgi:7,8-dihydropterin-6-yl-methyl-4-(beta-D-ribofuranosyl)aminobenzene 5'-phosphate synthase
MNKPKMILTAFVLAPLLFTALSGLRAWQAGQEVAEEWANFNAQPPALATTSGLEIIPLYEDASASQDYISGNGASYLIRTDSATILLDIGDNPDHLATAPMVQNMEALGIAWDEVYRVVISHPHPGHVGGLAAWRKGALSFGELPGGLGERQVFVPHVTTYKGAVHATIPTLPAPDVATTGVISYLETGPIALFTPKGGEQALVVHVAGQGLILITGCGHPGLERLFERAEALYGAQVIGIVGGLHLRNADADKLQAQIRFLQSRPVSLLALSLHNSGPDASSAFIRAFPGAYRTPKVGETIRLP